MMIVFLVWVVAGSAASFVKRIHEIYMYLASTTKIVSLNFVPAPHTLVLKSWRMAKNA
jgi:hypothetical protein